MAPRSRFVGRVACPPPYVAEGPLRLCGGKPRPYRDVRLARPFLALSELGLISSAFLKASVASP